MKIIVDEITIVELMLGCTKEQKNTEEERIYRIMDILLGFVEFDIMNRTMDSIFSSLHNRLRELDK